MRCGWWVVTHPQFKSPPTFAKLILPFAGSCSSRTSSPAPLILATLRYAGQTSPTASSSPSSPSAYPSSNCSSSGERSPDYCRSPRSPPSSESSFLESGSSRSPVPTTSLVGEDDHESVYGAFNNTKIRQRAAIACVPCHAAKTVCRGGTFRCTALWNRCQTMSISVAKFDG